MFKFRPRLVSGKRRSKVFWRVVVNIFIFRNSRNIQRLFFWHIQYNHRRPDEASSFRNLEWTSTNKSERGRKWMSSSHSPKMCVDENDIYAHLEGEDIYEQIWHRREKIYRLIVFLARYRETLFLSLAPKRNTKILGMQNTFLLGRLPFFLVRCALVVYELHEKWKLGLSTYLKIA